MDQSEPPSPCLRSHIFLVGKNSRGNWIAQDRSGLCGGLFVDRTHAVRFALFENGHNPDAIVIVPGTLELDMSAAASEGFEVHGQNALQSRAA